jgi:uncharacterized protein (TIGR02001 family)
MMKKSNLLYCCALILPFNAWAGFSATVTGVSDYLFNGVSQTQEDPAIQGSLDWAHDNGWYAGVWGSNVDFGEDTDVEADLYVGFYQDLNDSMNMDLGVAQYTYHGAGHSSDYDYAEAYAKFGFHHTNLNFWYAWDYFGTGAGHYIVMLTQTIPLTDAASLLLGVDRSASLDEDKFAWEDGDEDYIHWQITGNYSFHGFDMSLGVHGTDLDTYGDTTLLFTIGRTFEF